MFNISQQDLSINKKNKSLYGEIHTPYSLIKKMFRIIPKVLFKDPNMKWLDPGSGKGYFSIYLYNVLFESLKDIFIDDNKRREHIINNMLYMIDINEKNVQHLKRVFGKYANIYHGDYLTFDPIKIFNVEFFDMIIGNPPYNSDGMIKVPTNNILKKKRDGKTIWVKFIRRSIKLTNGFVCFIVPSIWMKRSKKSIAHILLNYKISKLHCFNNTETNALFYKQAQTPTCYFLLEKKESPGYIELYDKLNSTYVNYYYEDKPIPVDCISIINKLKPFVDKYGSLYPFVEKTNLPSKYANITAIEKKHYFKNIRTCVLKNKITPDLVYEYSDISLNYNGVCKLILAHKMYGFPYFDKNGEYGISNRDNYIIYNKSIEELYIIKDFLDSEMVRYLFDSTRYRMKNLEKDVFMLLPDISKIENKKGCSFEKLFKLDLIERKKIKYRFKYKYEKFI